MDGFSLCVAIYKLFLFVLDEQIFSAVNNSNNLVVVFPERIITVTLTKGLMPVRSS
jgi:hypothetical protein